MPLCRDQEKGTFLAPVQIKFSDASMVRDKFEPASTFTLDMSANMASSSRLIALLGKKDVPTDGVEDYCRFLSPAMGARGYAVEIARVPWAELGWIRAWVRLWQKSREWKGKWVLVQYTALMWSRRGFPLAFVIVLLMLKVRGARLVTVFHDVAPYSGKRLADRPFPAGIQGVIGKPGDLR